MPDAKKANRNKKMWEYAYKHPKSQEFIDFHMSRAFLKDKTNELSGEEDRYASDMYSNIVYPKKRNVNGTIVYDYNATKKVFRDLVRMDLSIKEAIGKEYRRILDTIPEGTPNREQRAAYLAERSEPGVIRSLFMSLATPVSMYQNSEFDGFEEYHKVTEETLKEFHSRMTEEERQLLSIGTDIANGGSKILDGFKPEDCGLTKAELNAIEQKSIDSLSLKVDRNFYNDDTMDDDPFFLDPQVASDYHERLKPYYLTLETTEEKLDLFEKGAFSTEAVPALFSNTAKNNFKQIVKEDLFAPTKKDESPDFEEFVKRVDGLAERSAGYNVETGKFVENGDMSGLFADNSPENRLYAGLRICPANIKYNALHSALEKAVENNESAAKYMKDYCLKNGMTEEDLKGGSLKSSFIEAFENKVKTLAYSMEDGKKYYKITKEGGVINLSEEEKKKIDERSEEVKAGMASAIYEQKVWLKPERNVNMVALGNLNNLYDQFDKEDSRFIINSSKYDKLWDALKEAHDKYEALAGKELSEKDRLECVRIFDRVADASAEYLSDKRMKDGQTERGENRYEIAFSALNVTSHGKAVAILSAHNVRRNLTGSKEISMTDLVERAGRDHSEQKAHEKMIKEGRKAKNRDSVLSRDSLADDAAFHRDM